jgi:general stress protein YciG
VSATARSFFTNRKLASEAGRKGGEASQIEHRRRQIERRRRLKESEGPSQR